MIVAKVVKVTSSEHEGYVIAYLQFTDGTKAKLHITPEAIQYLAEQVEQPTEDEEE